MSIVLTLVTQFILHYVNSSRSLFNLIYNIMAQIKDGAKMPEKTPFSKLVAFSDDNAANAFKSSIGSYVQYLLARGFSHSAIVTKLTECEKVILDMIDFDAE